MHVQSIVSVRELAQKSDIVLAEEILSKKIELSNPDAVKENDFYIHYDEHKKSLELRYMVYDERYDDYWEEQDVGELINYRDKDFDERLASLKNSKTPFFFIATYEHGLVRHYPLYTRESIPTCGWDTGISGIFVPSASFVKECKRRDTLHKRLEAYFKEYTDWCNGNVYALCKDSYLVDTSDQVIFIDDSDSVGGFIGYENATENLKSLS